MNRLKLNLFIGALCLLLGYLGGRYRTPQPEAKLAAKALIQASQVVHKNVTTTVTKKPTGEVVTTVVDNSTVTKDREEKSTKKESVPVPPRKPSYSLGVRAIKKLDANPPTYDLELGYRVTGDLWGTASYNLGDKAIGIGLRLEF